MAKIFISHSSKDEKLLKDMIEIFKETSVDYVIYRGRKGEHWKNIREDILNSDAVFLLLGSTISPDKRDSAHTQNWIAFEIGVACGYEPPKKLVVFHPAYDMNNPNEYNENRYVIPYLTDYIYYDSNNSLSYDIALNIIRNFDPYSEKSIGDKLLKSINSASIKHGNYITIYRDSKEDGAGTYIGKIECPSCHLKFNLVSCNNIILCPSCKEKIFLYYFNEP